MQQRHGYLSKLKQAGYTMIDTTMAVIVAGAGITATIVGAGVGMGSNQLHEALENIQTIQVRAEERYYPDNDNSYAGINGVRAIEYGLIPDDMLTGNGDIQNVYGGDVTIDNAQPLTMRLKILSNDIPKKQCQSLATALVRSGNEVRIFPQASIFPETSNLSAVIKTACQQASGRFAIKH